MEKKINNLDRAKRVFSTAKKALSPRGKRNGKKLSHDFEDQKNEAGKTVERHTQEISSTSRANKAIDRSGSSLGQPHKFDENSPTEHSINSPRNTEYSAGKAPIESSRRRSRSRSPLPIKAQTVRLTSRQQQRVMKKMIGRLRTENENLNHDDLKRVFNWQLKHSGEEISPDELKIFLDAEDKGWDDLGDFQPVKLKSNYLAYEHALVNKIDREIFYDAFMSMFEKHPFVNDGKGGKGISVAKGMTRESAVSEMVAVVQAEIKKPGYEFRWSEKKEIFLALSDFSMAVRRGRFSVDAWVKISQVLTEDKEFRKWSHFRQAEVKSTTAKGSQSPRDLDEQRTESLSTPSGRSRETTVSPEFCEDFFNLLAEHARQKGHNGQPYVPGEGGRQYLKAFVAGELRRNPNLSGLPEDVKKAFDKLTVAVQDESEKFNPKFWLNFKTAMENNPSVKRRPAPSQHKKMVAAPIDVKPLEFKTARFNYLIEPQKYTREDFLLASYENHAATGVAFSDVLVKVADDIQRLRPDISKTDMYKILAPKGRT